MMTMEKSTKRSSVLDYIEKYPPYHSVKNFGIDIRALSRYADEHDKMPAELSPEEVMQFKK